MALPDVVKLLGERETSGILPVAAVDHIAQGLHALARITHQPNRTPDFAINEGDLFARPEIRDRVGAFLRRHAVGDAPAIAAAVEAEHQPGPLRRAAMHERIDAERTVLPDQPRVEPFEIVEARPPHQRAVAENPKVLVVMIETCAHSNRGIAAALT